MSLAKVAGTLTLALLTVICTALGSAGPLLPSASSAGALGPRSTPKLDHRLPSAAGSEAAVKQLQEQGVYDSLVAAVDATRYRVSPRLATGTEPDGFQGANPAQRFAASFGANGFELRSTGGPPGWRLGLRLGAWGYGERLEPPGAALISAAGNRVEYRYPAGAAGDLTEWYVSTARGIEQGFTLAHPPAGARESGPLTLVVAVTGDLAPRLTPGGQAIQLVSPDGTAELGYSGLRAWDATGRTLPSRLTVEAEHMRLVVDDATATYPVTVDPIVYTETKLAASDPGDSFGYSVAISGDTVVVGAIGHNTGGKADAGQAYVYVRSGTSWSEQAKLTASNGAPYDYFGWSVAISGDTVVVGAPRDLQSTTAGQAYVYVRSGTSWSEQANLTPSDGAPADLFGYWVAISGDTVVVGAPAHDTNGNASAGQAYVYVSSGTSWSEQAKLTASNGALYDNFGWSVAISGDTVVVGAPWHTTGGNYQAGQAYVYVRSGTAWSEQAMLAASNGAPYDNLGYSVAISGDTVVVGAPAHDTAGGITNSGQAYVYVRSGTSWSEQAKLTASNGAAGDQFGWSVAISGDTVVVGAPFNDTGGKADAGHAYVHMRSGTSWSEQAKLMASNGAKYERFGWSVAISEDTLVVGNINGQAYVYVPAGAFNYSLSNSGEITVTPGAAGSNTITATLTEGSGQNVYVFFSTSELPSGATAAFDPGACTPTCTSQLTISTMASTPTGTFAITVTGSPLSKTTVFNVVVQSPTCAATAALDGTAGRKAKLSLLYAFRDKVLAATPNGRRYITTYYTHSAEAVWLMLRYPELRTRSLLQLERFFPTLQAMLAGRSARLTSADLADIDGLLAAFAARASAGLQADLRAAQQDLRQPTVLRTLGIAVGQDR